MEQKCPTTTRTILELRRYSKLTWGPNIRVLERIFLSIAEPMLLYAVQVWITATKVRWCITKLWSVQRLMLMTITRSFRSISTRSALVLTNSLPMEKRALHIAALATLKNSCSKNELVEGLLRQLMIEATDIDPPCPSYNLKIPPFQPLNLSITCSRKTPPPKLQPDTLNTFFISTDGSKTKKGTGYATNLTNLHGSVAKKCRRFPTLWGIFEAETHAIFTFLKITSKLLPPGSSVSIISDSKSSLRALGSKKKTISTIAKIQKLAFQVTKSYCVSFYWVPGHEGIAGNEIADQEARAAAENPRTRMKNSKICWSNAKEPFQNFLKQQWREEWEKENSASSITKEFFSNIDKAKILQFTNTPHQLIQILSGHSRLRTFFTKLE